MVFSSMKGNDGVKYHQEDKDTYEKNNPIQAPESNILKEMEENHNKISIKV